MPPVPTPPSLDVDALVDGFDHRTLPKPAWTHEAHLVVCWAWLRRLDGDADRSLQHLRGAISAYNQSVGTVNDESSGYHETLTRYYVGAVASCGPAPLEEVLAAPACARSAPGAHWSHDVLFSVPARLGWVAPDVAPTAFPIPGLSEPGRAGEGSRTRGRSRPAPA